MNLNPIRWWRKKLEREYKRGWDNGVRYAKNDIRHIDDPWNCPCVIVPFDDDKEGDKP